MENENVVAECCAKLRIEEVVSRKTGKPFNVLKITYDNGRVVNAGFVKDEVLYSMMAFCKDSE